MQSSNNLKKTIFFIIISSISTIFAQNIDIDLLRDINLNRDQSLDQTFKFLSDTDAPIAIATPIIIYSMGLLNKDKNLKKQAIFIGESLLVSTFITTAAKYSFKRVRPFTTYPELEKQSDGGSYSFPSGHTSAAFSTATALSIAFPKWYIITPAFLWASAVGYSRIDLGVHYPSDVLAGAFVGSGSAYLTFKINKCITKKSAKR
jgi:membrane-associated phospholipid phosphatase